MTRHLDAESKPSVNGQRHARRVNFKYSSDDEAFGCSQVDFEGISGGSVKICADFARAGGREGWCHSYETTDHDNLKYFWSTKKLNGRQARGRIFVPVGHQKSSRRPDYGDVKSGIIKSGTADAAMLPVLQNLIRDQEFESEYSAREARETGI